MNHDEIKRYYLHNVVGEFASWSDPQARLTRAFAQNEFILHKQSIRKLKPGFDDRSHIEILIRLKEEEEHLMAPGMFLPVLEHFHFESKLDRYIARRVLMWYFKNHSSHGPVMHVNLCGGTLTDPDFSSFVATELKATDLGGDCLCFEFPDIHKQYERATHTLVEDLRALDCCIAVGEFEQERMSFQAIKEFKPEFFKILGNLTRELAHQHVALAKYRSIVRVCRTIGIQTVALHVEDEHTLEMLMDLEVDYAQGYGISRPTPLEKSAGSGSDLI